MSRPKPSEILLKRLRDECGFEIPDGSRIERTRPSKDQRESGACTGHVIPPKGYYWDILFFEPIRLLAKSPSLTTRKYLDSWEVYTCSTPPPEAQDA